MACAGTRNKSARLSYLLIATVVILLSSAFIFNLSAQAQAVAGGKCGPEIAWLTPNTGSPGTTVEFNIPGKILYSELNFWLTYDPYPYIGKYELWWSRSPTALKENSAIKVGEGEKEKDKPSSISFVVPDGPPGTAYIFLVNPDQSIWDFGFSVTKGSSATNILPAPIISSSETDSLGIKPPPQLFEPAFPMHFLLGTPCYYASKLRGLRW